MGHVVHSGIDHCRIRRGMTGCAPDPKENADELSLLVEHYEKSYAIIQGRERARDRILWVLLSLSIALTLIVFTDMFAVSQPPRGGLPWMAYSLRGPGLQFVVWVLLLAATLRHLQIASRVEADYEYLHALETYLDGKMSWKFCRERIGYLPEYPLPSGRKAYSVLYKLLVPAFVVAQTSAAVLASCMTISLDFAPKSFAETTSLIAVAVWIVTTYLLFRPIGTFLWRNSWFAKRSHQLTAPEPP